MKIGVIGLGLIGGSIFKALKGKYEVVGVSSSVFSQAAKQQVHISTAITSARILFILILSFPKIPQKRLGVCLIIAFKHKIVNSFY